MDRESSDNKSVLFIKMKIAQRLRYNWGRCCTFCKVLKNGANFVKN
jgi:hypothetical protein